MNLEVRELKQSLERRDAYILELEGKLALAQSGEPVAYTDGHGMLWLPGERVTMSGTPIPLYTHPDTSAVRRSCMCKYVTVGREFCGLKRGECNLQEGAQDEATPVQVKAAKAKGEE